MFCFALSTLLLSSTTLSVAVPVFPRGVTLNPAAVAEAQQRDNTATRAFSATQIKTTSGQCFFVDPASGDFRENLTPVQVTNCNGSAGEQWDIITQGKHNDQPGFALIVSTLTNACLNFDPRRAPNNQVLLFSCGGRADGSGSVTNSQLFTFQGGPGPLPLIPQNGKNATCLTVNTSTNLLDQTACNPASVSGNELFTFGAGGSATTTGAAVQQPATTAPVVTSTHTASPTSKAATVTTATATKVSGVGGVLNPSAVAESQQRDNNATRAFSAVQVKTADGKCWSVSATAGNFRENLIPIEVKTCDGGPGQRWDVITQGKHDNVPGTALIVSSLTQGCVNFDPRKAPGSQVRLFSCGGRADGAGKVTNSQQFSFHGGAGPLPLLPVNGKNATCLDVNASTGLLDQTACSPSTVTRNELFSFVA